MPATKYLYLEDRNAEVDSLLAWEPAVFGDLPLGLFTSGEVRAVSRDEIQTARTGSVDNLESRSEVTTGVVTP